MSAFGGLAAWLFKGLGAGLTASAVLINGTQKAALGADRITCPYSGTDTQPIGLGRVLIKVLAMSAFGGKADIPAHYRDVRF